MRDYRTLARLARKWLVKTGATPEYVLFQITSKCNIKCVHCFLWEDTNYGWENTNFGKFDMSLEQIKSLSASMPDFYFMNMTGGEPYLRPDMVEIVETFYRNNRLRALLTPSNGTVTDRMLQVIPEVLRRCPELTMAVDISLDGLEDAHDTIRGGKGIFQKAIHTFREIKKLQASQPRLQTGVIIACMKSNQDDLLRIYDFVRNDLGPDSISVALVRGKPLDRGEKDVDLSKYAAIIKRLSEDLVSDGLSGFRKTLAPGFTVAAKIKMHEEIIKIVTSGYQSPCYAAALNTVIYSNGDVYPCEILGVDKKLGNLRDFDFDFRKLWDSPRRKEIQRWVVDSKCHCTHECHVPINLLFNPARLPALARLSMQLP